MEGKTMDKKLFVSRLKELREKNNLKQRDMYEAMQCSQSAYSSYENPDSVKFPSAENLYNLSQHFNVSIDWLLGNDVEEKKHDNSTLADVIRQLFWIDNQVELKIECIQNSIQLQGGWESTGEFIDGYYIYFPQYLGHEIELNDFLKDWKDVKGFCDGKDIGKNMYDLWKKDVLKKASEIPLIDSIYQNIPFDHTNEGFNF